ncbi:MAG TPA: hypothetical protein VFT66_17295 [Roseiflexaceae bacterium]|nr:hypothetical protein [Roseiflexaceae bacterium]
MAGRRGNGAMWALLLAGGAWAWQNRDKIRGWAESNPQVREKVNQVAQSNPQIRDILEKQVGWQTPSGSSSSQPPYQGGSYNTGATGGNDSTDNTYNSGMNTGPSFPATGETRRISPDDTRQDSRGSGI